MFLRTFVSAFIVQGLEVYGILSSKHLLVNSISKYLFLLCYYSVNHLLCVDNACTDVCDCCEYLLSLVSPYLRITLYIPGFI